MKRVKVFKSYYDLQVEIDKWIEKENPNIISISSSCSATPSFTFAIVTILYDDGKTENLKV
jgi:hypothetical protein